VSHPEWWILANVGAAIIAIFIVAVVTLLNAFVDDPNIYSILFGLIYTMTTGFAVVELLRHPKPDAEWRVAMRAEPVLERTSDTMLGSVLYAQGTAGRSGGQNTNETSEQGDHNT
jgi:hypothetical protein